MTSSAAWADPTRVLALSGTVEMQTEPDAAFKPATVGDEVPEGGTVRTSGDGRAELLYPDGSHIWMKENTAVTIETQRSLLSRLSITWGSIKAKIPHLASNRRMEFKTSTAVAAVRGTELVITQDKGGKYDLEVMYGNVEVRLTGLPKSFFVPQGHGYGADEAGKPGQARLLTRGEELRGLENWAPAMAPEDRIKEIQQKDEARQEVRNFVGQQQNLQHQLNQVVQKPIQDDMEAGRTLQDVFGNLVRVEQIMIRPTASSVQLVNLVERPNYTYNASALPFASQQGAQYNGPTTITNRLDSMQLNVDFGTGNSLPAQIPAWPEFFSNHSPQTLSAIFANETALGTALAGTSANMFAMAFYGARDPYGNLHPNLFIGTPTCTAGSSSCLKYLDPTTINSCGGGGPCFLKGFDEYANNGGGSVEKTFTNLTELTEKAWTGVPSATLSQAATLGTNSTVWVTQQNMVIDNNGSPRSLTDFTNSTSDPFSILSNSAFESILQLKQNQTSSCPGGASSCASNTDFLASSNIDLVILPDLAVSALEQIATSARSFQVQSQ